MGILDSYPHPYALLPPPVCEQLEQDAVSWRWRLRGLVHRLSKVHGDFHPWNILFGEGTDFSLLDRSRGEWGEPADDVAALAVNYLFFGLRRGSDDDNTVSEPFDILFHTFMETYLRDSGDQEILEVLPPFFAFRALVVAHPRWYPTLSPGVRTALIGFARWMMAARRLEPGDIWTRWEALR
jgi:Phosphotransferase enzyme family